MVVERQSKQAKGNHVSEPSPCFVRVSPPPPSPPRVWHTVRAGHLISHRCVLLLEARAGRVGCAICWLISLRFTAREFALPWAGQRLRLMAADLASTRRREPERPQRIARSVSPRLFSAPRPNRAES